VMFQDDHSKDFYDWLRHVNEEVFQLCFGRPSFFRGMSPIHNLKPKYDPEIEFSLIPKIGREEYLKFLVNEYDAFMSFKDNAGKMIEGLSGWEILALMRHHNIPTRFLDWTESVDIALYFAVRGLEKLGNDDDVAIWILNSTKLNNLNNQQSATLTAFDSIKPYEIKDNENHTKMFNFLLRKFKVYKKIKNSDELIKYLEKIKSRDSYRTFLEIQKSKIDFLNHRMDSNKLTENEYLQYLKKSHVPKQKAIFVIPPRKHLRVSAQKSFFTLHYDLNPLNKVYERRGCLKVITLPKRMIPSARRHFKLNGLNDHTLFPDLDGLSSYISASYFKKQMIF
jgi:hypothetical protein